MASTVGADSCSCLLINRKTHANQRKPAAAASTPASVSSSSPVKALKSPAPLPAAAASVPLASRPRVIARIVRKSAAAAAAAVTKPQVPSELQNMLYVPPPSYAQAAASSIEQLQPAESKSVMMHHHQHHIPVADDSTAREPVSPSSSQSSLLSYSSSHGSIDFQYGDDEATSPSSTVSRLSPPMMFNCSSGCGATFYSQAGLDHHERLHQAQAAINRSTAFSTLAVAAAAVDRWYSCGDCKYQCGDEAELRHHEATQHVAEATSPRAHPAQAIVAASASGAFPCASCGQEFKRRGNLLRHIKLRICAGTTVAEAEAKAAAVALSTAVPAITPPSTPVLSAITSPALAAQAMPSLGTPFMVPLTTPQLQPLSSPSLLPLPSPASCDQQEQPTTLLAGGFFPPLASSQSAASSFDKEGQVRVTTVSAIIDGVPMECPLMYGDDGEGSPVHNEHALTTPPEYVLDDMMHSSSFEPLPSGLAYHHATTLPVVTGGPVSITRQVSGSSGSTVPLTTDSDEPVLYDVYTFDTSSLQL